MRISELYATRRPVFSFEFFPPKTDAGYRALYRTIEELKQLEPAFVSVTSHARGENRSKTAELVMRIQSELGITAMAHMTCTGQTPAELAETLAELARAGIENVMALRGDAPKDQPDWRPVPGGFRYGSELAAFVKSRCDFSIGGGCYPEVHPEAPSPAADLAQPEAQARRRRRVPDHAALLRTTSTTSASSSARAPPASRCRSCRASCRS